jgi:hypothetical protein
MSYSECQIGPNVPCWLHLSPQSWLPQPNFEMNPRAMRLSSDHAMMTGAEPATSNRSEKNDRHCWLAGHRWEFYRRNSSRNGSQVMRMSPAI